MKKMFFLGALCAAVLASCSGEKKEFATEPQADPIAWQDTVKFEDNLKGGLTGFDVKGYNAAGQLALVETYNVRDGKTTLATAVIYQNGKPAYGKDFEGEKVVGTEVWTYNPGGQLVEQVQSQFVVEKQKLEPTVKYTYTYDAAGNLTNIVEADYANLRYTDVYEWTYAYDEQGRLAERKDYTFEGGRKQANWYTFKYNDQNQLEQKDYYFYDIKGGKLKHDAKTRYTYNAAGQELTATLIRHKNNQKRDDINSRLYTKEYNEAGQLTYDGEQRWDSHNNVWTTSSHSTSLSYDEQGRLAVKTTLMNTNKGLKKLDEITIYGTPADKVAPTPASPVATTKPVVNLQDKNKTSQDED